MTMTAHTAAEPSNPEPEPTPSGPNLPELYRLLSTLIQDPGEFFDGLIEIEANPGQVTVTPWHLNQPVIDLTRLPNPLVPPARPNPHDPEEAPPGPLKLSIIQTETDKKLSIREILEQQFETAMLHRARHLLRAESDAGRAAAQDHRQWDEPTRARTLLAAAKCVFHASNINPDLTDYIDELDQDVNGELENMLTAPVMEMLSVNCPTRSGPEDPRESPFQRTQATISQYNKATLLLACSTETLAANAGAVPWILAQPEAEEAPNHQGQFMGSERAAAMRQGMTALGWNAMTHMEPHTTRGVINQCLDLTEAAGIVNWLAGLGQKPSSSTLTEILNRPDLRVKLRQQPENLQQENAGRAAALAIRGTACNTPATRTGRQERQNVADALTYAHVLAMEGRRVTATTFGGLIKAVNRWHAQLNREKTREQWENIVAANGGVVRRWQPVMEHFHHQEVTATELTDEAMLLAEALELDHCVHLYGPRSERGTVRIFSLSDQSGGRATTSITMQHGTWQVEQTRIRANHPAPEAMRECARELVAACNRAS